MSDTSITRTRRQLRKKGMGKDRKKQLAKKGTTPPFPIHPDGEAKQSAKPGKTEPAASPASSSADQN